MNKRDYIVIKSPELSKTEDRFIVISKITGEILDDAKGYGFKTKITAHKSYSFLSKDINAKKLFNQKREIIKNYCINNDDFLTSFMQIVSTLEKSRKSVKDNFNTKDIVNLLRLTKSKSFNNFTVKDLYKYLVG